VSEFPREEDLADLVGDAQYVQQARWRLFLDLDGELSGKSVLLVLGGSWTILPAAEFRRLAERILRQLDE
jgi:hypothetical protein